MSLKNILKTTLIIGEIIILPFVLSYICQRLSIGRGYEYSSINPNIILINYLLWLFLFIFLLGLFKKNYLALFVYLVVFTLFTLINRYKIKLLNQPFQIQDLNFGKELNILIPFLKDHTKLIFEVIASFIGLIVSFFVFKAVIKTENKRPIFRPFLIIISSFVFTFPYFFPTQFNQILDFERISFGNWDSAENCRNNGMILCFVYNFQFFKHSVPMDYSQINVTNIYQNISQTENKKSNTKPNLIVILSESLWDGVNLTNTKYSQDPISQIRPDIKGNFISPSFGGETANIEFEILTGLNNYLFERDAFPYMESINRNIPSLFTIFKNNQYQTTVIHPYSPWFYNRNKVYKYFGLDKFTNLSNMSGYETAGPFVSDKSFTQEILDQFNSSDNPQFIFAISMQNHAPYEPNRFKDKKIKIENNLNISDKEILQSYIEGINLSSQYYQTIKQEIQKSQKPTIIILFGDHLPFLGNNFDIYKKLSFVPSNENQWTNEDKFKMHSTPLAIWSNFPKKIDSIDNISPAFLSNLILDLAEISPEYQFKFTNQFRKSIPYLTKGTSPDISNYSKNINDYRLIQYDLLFGKGYTWQFK